MHGQVGPIHGAHTDCSTEQPPPFADKVWLRIVGRQPKRERSENGKGV